MLIYNKMDISTRTEINKEIKNETKNESRCCHTLVRGARKGGQCPQRRKKGHEKCYLHMGYADKVAYDLGRGVSQEVIDARQKKKVQQARDSIRKVRSREVRSHDEVRSHEVRSG